MDRLGQGFVCRSSRKGVKKESMIPKGLSVSNDHEGKDESDLLESRDVDAPFHAAEPRAYVQGYPKVGRLFIDYRKT